MKKILSIVLVAAMILTQMLVFASATGDVTVTIGTVETEPNTTVEVYISLSNADAVKTIGLNEFEYDRTALTLKSGESLVTGAIIANWDSEKEAMAITYADNTSCNGNILKLTFEVGSSVGRKEIKCNAIVKTMNNGAEAEISSQVTAGAVNVAGVVFEDKTCEYDGTEKDISVSGILPQGATVEYSYNGERLDEPFKAINAGEYDVTATVKQDGKEDKVLEATLKIEPKNLTVTGLKAENKTYDGTTDAVVSGGELVGVSPEDNVNVTFPETGTFANKNAGERITVTIGELVLDGDDKDNYKLVQPDTLTANIEKKEVSVTELNIVDKSVSFDGVIEEDKSNVTLDFDKLNFEIVEDKESIEDEIPEDEAVDSEIDVIITNFVLKGDSAANYITVTENFTVTVSADAVAAVSIAATNGTVTGEGTYFAGSEITVTAVPNDGYKFSGWYIDDELVYSEAEYTFTLDADTALTAKFTKKSSGVTGGGGLSAGGDTSNKGAEKFDNEGSESAGRDETSGQDNGTPSGTVPSLDSTNGFVDLSGYAWAEEAINSLAQGGIIKGTSATTYSPAAKITRADFAALIVRIFELTSANEENFDDVATTDYFAPELAIARNTGVVSGIGDNKFAPRNSISRQDMMVMIHRAMEALGIELGEGEEVTATDFDTVSEYAKEAVSALMANGIITGRNGSIDPAAYATRAEVAVMLSRVLEVVK